MSAWTTRTAGIAALRTQMQDAAAPQRYSDVELGEALDEAIALVSSERPIISVVSATLDASRVVRLDNAIGAIGVRRGRRCRRLPRVRRSLGWYYFEQASQQKVLIPATLAAGATVTITVRGGYGFGVSLTTGSGTVVTDTNIPAAWRDALLAGRAGLRAGTVRGA